MTVNDALKMFTETFDMKEKDKKVIKKNTNNYLR